MVNNTVVVDGHIYTNADISALTITKAMGGNGLPCGNATMSTLSVDLPFNYFSNRAKVEVFSDSVLMGTFYIAKRQRRTLTTGETRLKLTCYDRMAFANAEFLLEGDEVTYTQALTYICDEMGVTLDGSITDYPLANTQARTIREVLGMIASASGGNFIITANDKLKLIGVGGSTRDFTSTDYTAVRTDASYAITKVEVTGETETFTAGTGGSLNTLKVSNPSATQLMADRILLNYTGIEYRPFECSKVLANQNIDLMDKVYFGSYVIGYDFYVTNITLNLTQAGIYATLSAGAVDEVQDDFAFEGTLTREVNRKYTTGKTLKGTALGKYGMKSSAITDTGDSVGAAAATIEKSIVIADGVLTGKHKMSETEIDTGTLFVDDTDTENISLNLACKGLKTTAQDVKGAINELFMLGGDWAPPSDWLTLPPALDGEITLLVNNVGVTTLSIGGTGSPVTVDWGDGNTETIAIDGSMHTHTYTAEGHMAANGSMQYIARISGITGGMTPSIKSANYITPSLLMASVNADVSASTQLFSYCYALCKADFLSGTTLPAYALQDCYSLKILDLANTFTTLLESSIYGCRGLKKLDLSKTLITTIPQSCCYACYALVRVLLPNAVAEIEYSAFYTCYALQEINIPDGCIIGTYAFEGCYSLYPKP